MATADDLKVLASPPPVVPEPQAQEPTTPQTGEPESQPSQQAFDPESFRKQVLEEARREAQSLVDKSSANLSRKAQKLYDDTMDALKRTGIEVTPEMKAQVRRNVQEGVMFDEPPAPEAGGRQTTPQVQQPAQGQQAQPQQVTELEAAIAWAKTVNGINENDPEYAVLNPDDLYISTRVAVEMKKRRLAEQADRNPGATMVAHGGGTPSGYDPTKPPEYYLEQASKKR